MWKMPPSNDTVVFNCGKLAKQPDAWWHWSSTARQSVVQPVEWRWTECESTTRLFPSISWNENTTIKHMNGNEWCYFLVSDWLTDSTNPTRKKCTNRPESQLAKCSWFKTWGLHGTLHELNVGIILFTCVRRNVFSKSHVLQDFL
jgi:hypothetical protein